MSTARPNGEALGTYYLLFSLMWLLPAPMCFAALLAPVPLVLVNDELQGVNHEAAPRLDHNDAITVPNLLAVLGSWAVVATSFMWR